MITTISVVITINSVEMRESKYSYSHTHEKKEVKLSEGIHRFKKFKERRREEEAAEFVCLSSSDFHRGEAQLCERMTDVEDKGQRG